VNICCAAGSKRVLKYKRVLWISTSDLAESVATSDPSTVTPNEPNVGPVTPYTEIAEP